VFAEAPEYGADHRGVTYCRCGRPRTNDVHRTPAAAWPRVDDDAAQLSRRILGERED
jgi:hypothetical protein